MKNTFFLALLVIVSTGCSANVVKKRELCRENLPLEYAGRSREILYSTAWMQTAEEYRASTQQAFRSACVQLPEALKAGSADLSQQVRPEAEWKNLPTAIVFDLDETLLDNSAYQAWQVKTKSGYNELTWDAWVESEQATAVPGAVDFVTKALDCSCGESCVEKVFFVSNRACLHSIDDAEDEEEAFELCPQLAHTMEVMKKCSFPSAADRSSYYLAGMYAGLTSKQKIREKIGDEYRIIMLVGDNLRDFVEERQEYRERKTELGEMWGRRWIILPNPSYGSWPDDLIPDEVREEIKARCGERPRGPENWADTKKWDDCAYPYQYRAREESLKAWSGRD